MDEAAFSRNRPARGRRWAFALIKLLIVAAVLWGVHRTVESALADLERHRWSMADLRPGWLVAAAVLYLLGMLPNGLFWHRTMRALGQQPRLGETLRAYYIGHLGKYVPGKALVVVLRAALVRSSRVDVTIATACVFYETLNMVAVGAFVSGAIMAAAYRHQTVLLAVAVGMMVLAGLPTLPPVFRRLAMLAGVGRRSPEAVDKLSHLSYSRLAIGWLSVAAGWVLVGVSLWCTVKASGLAPGPGSASEITLCVAAAALAVVAGFVSLVPGGAFIREAIILELLLPTFGEAGALVSAVLARLVWLGAEVAISAVLYYGGAKPSGNETPPATEKNTHIP